MWCTCLSLPFWMTGTYCGFGKRGNGRAFLVGDIDIYHSIRKKIITTPVEERQNLVYTMAALLLDILTPIIWFFRERRGILYILHQYSVEKSSGSVTWRNGNWNGHLEKWQSSQMKCITSLHLKVCAPKGGLRLIVLQYGKLVNLNRLYNMAINKSIFILMHSIVWF